MKALSESLAHLTSLSARVLIVGSVIPEEEKGMSTLMSTSPFSRGLSSDVASSPDLRFLRDCIDRVPESDGAKLAARMKLVIPTDQGNVEHEVSCMSRVLFPLIVATQRTLRGIFLALSLFLIVVQVVEFVLSS